MARPIGDLRGPALRAPAAPLRGTPTEAAPTRSRDVWVRPRVSDELAADTNSARPGDPFHPSDRFPASWWMSWPSARRETPSMASWASTGAVLREGVTLARRRGAELPAPTGRQAGD